MNLPTNKRTYFIGASIALTLIFIVIFIFTRPKTGTLTVTAHSSVQISSAKINGVTLEESTSRDSGSQSFDLPVGRYLITGEGSVNLYKVAVKINEGEEKAVVFEDYELQELNPQDSLKAKHFTKAGSNYRYLDNEDGVLYTYYGADIVPERYNFNARNISEVSWLSSSKAVAVVNEQLYKVSKNDFSYLKYPNGQQPELDIQPIVTGYSVSNESQIYAVIDGALYRYKSLSAAPELVSSLGNFSTFPFSSPNGTVALATDTTLSGHREEEPINSVVSNSGKTIVDSFSERGVYFVKWSPDNQRFIYSDDVGLWLYDIESRSSKLIVKGSDFSSGSIIWVDGSRILHYDRGYLWEYDVDSGVGFAKYNFAQPELLSDFTSPGSMTLISNEFVLSIDTQSTVSPSKLFFIPIQE